MVFGSKFVSIFTLDVDEETEQITVGQLWTLGPFCDWIKDVAWYYAEEDDTLVMHYLDIW